MHILSQVLTRLKGLFLRIRGYMAALDNPRPTVGAIVKVDLVLNLFIDTVPDSQI